MLYLQFWSAFANEWSVKTSDSETDSEIASPAPVLMAVEDAAELPAIAYDEPVIDSDFVHESLEPQVASALLCELIREVHAENGGCYLTISHDLNTARRIADFLAVLWNGKIVESGPKEELFDSDNAFVSQFLNADINGPLSMD